ncbi:MAG: DUF4398 domain-containing protein [Deltaproteobacteria bacterium]|nr:DUF4398 domain-containing protein [Deltaproteobacteria bacterium]
MSFMKKSILKSAIVLTIAVMIPVVLWAGDSITPAQEQEFIDAKSALESARGANAEKYAASHMKQAEENLSKAIQSRQIPDSVEFSRGSLLARAYAELALALSELENNVEQLSATQEAIVKAKAEIEQMKTRP